jgi:AraC-like DNA-binding protein
MSPMKTLFSRIYSDYLMPSRLAHHERLIRLAREAGYTQTSVRDFFSAVQQRTPLERKVILHRHDIDTDLRTARKLFEIEKRQGIRASYYFRLGTLDYALMQEIEEYGSEASYHYEELATFAKRNNIKDPAEIRRRLPEIRSEFAANFGLVERRLGTKMRTVASHGDFANRRLQISNTEILADPQLRAECGIECEAYDHKLLVHFDIYIADRPPPTFYHPSSPFDAIAGRHDRICLLTHPRQFETNWTANTKDNLLRCYQGLAW